MDSTAFVVRKKRFKSPSRSSVVIVRISSRPSRRLFVASELIVRSQLATWLDLPDGKTPSRNCICTFFARVDPTAFQACFFAWLDGLAGDSKQSNGLRIVAIDGKSLRHSFDTRKELRPLHLVSAWVAECHISLGQVATEEKSNEITAIPELLGQIDIEDAIVTIDAPRQANRRVVRRRSPERSRRRKGNS